MRANQSIFRAQQLAISSQGSSEEEKENSPSKNRFMLLHELEQIILFLEHSS